MGLPRDFISYHHGVWPDEVSRVRPEFGALLKQYQELNAEFVGLMKSGPAHLFLPQIREHRERVRQFRLALRRWRQVSDHDLVATEHLTGDGWLHCGTECIGRVSYRIGVAHFSQPSDGTELHVELSHHSIDPGPWQDLVVSLDLPNGRKVFGFLSPDGSRLVRTGTLAP